VPGIAVACAGRERKETGAQMTAETAIFTCSICGEPSKEICVCCTKDACENHRCLRCKRCSDCCECEAPLSASEVNDEPEIPAEPAAAPEAAISSPEPDSATEVPGLWAPETSVDQESTAEGGIDESAVQDSRTHDSGTHESEPHDSDRGEPHP
jgi:hypothetical protein